MHSRPHAKKVWWAAILRPTGLSRGGCREPRRSLRTGAVRMEAIVLAGGRGTRLASMIHGVPKVLAPVGNRPFLELLLHRLRQKGMERVVLSVGYLASSIRDHFGDEFDGLEVAYAVEQEPLGTG